MGEAIGTTPTERRIIGLTGGIATGKSTVPAYLASKHNLPVLDADVYARQAVEKGSKILDAITHRHGPQLLLSDGTLDRQALGNLIFTNPTEKHWLEQQIHPFVRDQFHQTTAASPPGQTLVYAIPLLFEANLTHIVTEIWVVTCTPQQQLQRLIERNSLTTKQAQARINAQMPLSEKSQRADHSLNNCGSRESLFEQIDQLVGHSSSRPQRQH
ncbi:MAG: dephospho-CoA kinase [Cyanobacteria bacterium P01_D01_bin.36]